MSDAPYPVTPDGRYFVVRGRLWRKTDPSLPEERRAALVADLMRARRTRDREGVDKAKRALGERGPVWWTDGAPDFNRHLARNTPYATWFAALPQPSAEIPDAEARERA
ncbi:hypothetical protein [Sphingomonas sp.]|uniref:hypothetical protein n=1 Tax=Sphingomonas sp. TaxID=28214 RepID=UPI003B3ADD58